MSKSNVIDLKPYLKSGRKGKLLKISNTGEPAHVIDMAQKKEEILSQERREKKRTILTEFVGAFLVVPNNGLNLGGLQKVDLYDISANGLAFDSETKIGQLKAGDEIAMRIYLSQKSYFPFVVKIANNRYIKDEESFRYGCEFMKSTANKEALAHFVKFIETVAIDMKVDTGDLLTHSSKK